tara:strand:- start:830 stop:976 length:147 start_codon:yes stop_codon:yes gene_type:complete
MTGKCSDVLTSSKVHFKRFFRRIPLKTVSEKPFTVPEISNDAQHASHD